MSLITDTDAPAGQGRRLPVGTVHRRTTGVAGCSLPTTTCVDLAPRPGLFNMAVTCKNILTRDREVAIVPGPDGDELLTQLAALANPVRLRILAALATERGYVSQLARDLHISRPLLHMHLRRLEDAGLVRGSLELSPDGKAMRYFDITAFDLRLTPAALVHAVKTLTVHEPRQGSIDKE